MLGVALTAAMWWIYFDVVAIVAGRRLAEAEPGRVQNEMARDSYSYLHLVMVAGIVLVALGLKKTIGHFDDHLHAVPAFALLGGLAIYLLGHVAFRYRHVHTVNRRRLLLAIVLLILVPVATEVPALVALAIANVLIWAMIAYETRLLRRGPPPGPPAPGRRGLSAAAARAERVLELLHDPGDREAEGAGQGAPVGDADCQRVAAGGAHEGGDGGDHEEDRAELVDGDDPPAEVAAAPEARSRRRSRPSPGGRRRGRARSRPCPATRRGDPRRPAPSSSMNESTRLIAKTSVPAKRTTALSHASRRGSRDHQRQRAGADPARLVRLVDHLQHRGVAAGAEEDAADQVDRA